MKIEEIRAKRLELEREMRDLRRKIEHVRLDMKHLELECAHPNKYVRDVMGRDTTTCCDDCGMRD